jgi:gamma-glutamyltranspeptidase
MLNPIARSHRPLIMGRRGAVASNHPAATQAGLDILRAGGNAVDATVAVSLALGVAEPCMSGLGGDGFYHVWMAETGTSTVYNGTGAAPLATTPERFAKSGIAIEGPLSTSTPGGLGGLYAMHGAHGGLPWSDLAKPAIDLAREGFLATHAYRKYASASLDKLRADPISRAVFLHDGEVPALGDAIVQPDLAETLEAIAEGGAEGFYRGALAERLAHAMSEVGGMVTGVDLAGFVPEIQAPIAIDYRGYEVRQTAPNSTGFVLLQELKIVERFDLTSLGLGSAELIHLLVEAKKRAFVDRERHGADPRFADIPIEKLLSDAYTGELAATIDASRATDMPLTEPGHGGGDTTYFCVIDEAGNVVSAIQSLNSGFGSGVTAGRTGVLLNNRMAYWHLGRGHANALRPGKRVRHTMNAPMVFRDGRPWAVFGTPGADHQVQVNLQVLVSMIDFGLDPQQALEAPRWTSSQVGQDANWPHEGDGTLSMEEGFAEETLNALRALGHDLRAVPYLEGPCSVACIRVLDNGTRMAGSDPRRDGWAAAY